MPEIDRLSVKFSKDEDLQPNVWHFLWVTPWGMSSGSPHLIAGKIETLIIFASKVNYILIRFLFYVDRRDRAQTTEQCCCTGNILRGQSRRWGDLKCHLILEDFGEQMRSTRKTSELENSLHRKALRVRSTIMRALVDMGGGATEHWDSR